MSEAPPYVATEAHIPGFEQSSYSLDLRFDQPHLSWHAGVEEAITIRSISEYESSGAIPKGFFDLPYIKSLKIIELAPGLAQFLPTYAPIAENKPIAVDIIDYHEIIKFLTSALPRCTATQKEIVKVMIERAQIITHKVDYICCPVENIKYDHS